MTTKKFTRPQPKQSGRYGGTEFAVQRGTAICDTGTKFPNFKVTENDNLYANSLQGIADFLVVTEDDLMFDPPAVPFGMCLLNNQNCLYGPSGKWEDTYSGLQSGGKKLVSDISYLMCVKGGKITVRETGQMNSVTICDQKDADEHFQNQLGGLVTYDGPNSIAETIVNVVNYALHKLKASASQAPTTDCDGKTTTTVGGNGGSGGGGGNGSGGGSGGGYNPGGGGSIPPTTGTCDCATANLVWGKKINCDQRRKVIDVCKRLEIDPNWLMAVMALETARSFDPAKDNGRGYVGLIQFGSAAASDLGTTTAQLKAMSFIEQMDYVERFLAPRKAKYKTLVDVYLSVLYPAACGQGENRNYVVLRGRQANLNPVFHIDGDNNTTYVWEIATIIEQLFNEGKGQMVPNYDDCEYISTPGVPIVGECKQTGHKRTDERIAQLHPAIQCVVRNFINEVNRRTGRTYQVHSGYRSFAEQQEVYNRGHSTVKPGYSYHNYGLAIDVSWVQPGGYVDFNDHESLLLIGPIGEEFGFFWGGRWTSFVDNPHYQYTFGYKCAELKTMYHAVGDDYTKIKLP